MSTDPLTWAAATEYPTPTELTNELFDLAIGLCRGGHELPAISTAAIALDAAVILHGEPVRGWSPYLRAERSISALHGVRVTAFPEQAQRNELVRSILLQLAGHLEQLRQRVAASSSELQYLLALDASLNVDVEEALDADARAWADMLADLPIDLEG